MMFRFDGAVCVRKRISESQAPVAVVMPTSTTQPSHGCLSFVFTQVAVPSLANVARQSRAEHCVRTASERARFNPASSSLASDVSRFDAMKLWNAGSANAEMMANSNTTIISSIKVKPCWADLAGIMSCKSMRRICDLRLNQRSVNLDPTMTNGRSHRPNGAAPTARVKCVTRPRRPALLHNAHRTSHALSS